MSNQLVPLGAFSREMIGGTYTTATGDQGGTSAVVFKVLVACTKIRVLFTNYTINTPNEIISSLSPITIGNVSCQAISDTGTPVAMSFGGQGAVTLNPGSQIYTDFFTGTFAAGQFVQIRTYATVATVGQLIPLAAYSLNNASGVPGYTGTDGDNYKQHGSGAGSNQTTNPGAASVWRTSASNQPCYGPIALEGIATDGVLRPIVACVGDSIFQGAYDGTTNDGTQGAHIRSLVGMSAPYYNMGINGEILSQIVQGGNSFFQRLQRVQRSTAIIDEYGTNDFNSGQTFATLKANKLLWWQFLTTLSGASIFPTTLLPRVTGTVTSTTTQTVNSNAAAYQSFNAWIRAPYSSGAGVSARYDAAQVGVTIPYIIDTASTVETTSANATPGGPSAPLTGNLWYCGASNNTAYTNEGIHPLTNGSLLMKAAYDGAQSAIFATAPSVGGSLVGARLLRRF